jgi:hypothetical protein
MPVEEGVDSSGSGVGSGVETGASGSGRDYSTGHGALFTSQGGGDNSGDGDGDGDGRSVVPLLDLTVHQVSLLLIQLNMSMYVEEFRGNEVSGLTLSTCEGVGDVEELGVRLRAKARELLHHLRKSKCLAVCPEDYCLSHLQTSSIINIKKKDKDKNKDKNSSKDR